jgi:predicted nucleic acid-binding protein
VVIATIYVDTSAFLKVLFSDEAGHAAMVSFLDQAKRQGHRLVSSRLLKVEALRVVRRQVNEGRATQALVDQTLVSLRAFDLISPTPMLLDQAAFLEPTIKTLDAIHAATALALRPDLTQAATYDSPLQDLLAAQGIATVAP